MFDTEYSSTSNEIDKWILIKGCYAISRIYIYKELLLKKINFLLKRRKSMGKVKLFYTSRDYFGKSIEALRHYFGKSLSIDLPLTFNNY